MQDCWSFPCCLSWTLGSSSKCSQLKSFIGITLVDVYLNWLNWFCFFKITNYSDRFHDSSVTIFRCYKDVYVNSFFPFTARLWNSMPIECFHLTYDLSGFKSIFNRRLLTVVSFSTHFLYALIFLCFFFI